jgi:hypothetical protein
MTAFPLAAHHTFGGPFSEQPTTNASPRRDILIGPATRSSYMGDCTKATAYAHQEFLIYIKPTMCIRQLESDVSPLEDEASCPSIFLSIYSLQA